MHNVWLLGIFMQLAAVIYEINEAVLASAEMNICILYFESLSLAKLVAGLRIRGPGLCEYVFLPVSPKDVSIDLRNSCSS